MRKILLLSSNDRRRYAEDIQTALAAPDGTVIQFRYRERWVTRKLRRAVEANEVAGGEAILGFVADVLTNDPFIVPIRYAAIIEAVYVADMYIFKLRLGGYVDLAQYPRTFAGIVKSSRAALELMKTSEKDLFYPATTSLPSLPGEVEDDAPARWLEAARRLAVHPTFEHSYFLRVDQVRTHAHEVLEFTDDGHIVAVDGHTLRIVANFFAEQYAPGAEFKLTCATDGTNLRVASDEVYDVELRYDSVEFWLHPTAHNFDTLTRVTISLSRRNDSSMAIPAHVRIPLVVKRSKKRLFWRWVTTSAGAALVALPALLGPGVPLQLRAGAAVVGAGLLAFSAAVLTSSK